MDKTKKCLDDLEGLIQVLESSEDFLDRKLLIHEIKNFLFNHGKFLSNLIDPYCSIEANKRPWNVEIGHIRIFLDQLNNEPFVYESGYILTNLNNLIKELTDLFRDLVRTFLL